ncbi:MAG TPA: CDP-alcohol phosphatidyltransferase family protein [Bacteroidota bacterium]|nr:CDP-alcohol phosphatidyltransferase family protein [Bacteroidota bacterium]
MSQIESTYKSIDVEETIDIYFYRPVGYYIARVCQALGITPNVVTIVSIVIGAYGGHLLYFRDVTTNAWGIFLWVVADTLDSVDGQLARMTDHKSKFGRILDGFGGNIIFTSIYLHLAARIIASGHSAWFILLVLAGGLSHSIQSALADYYRNAYLKFVVDPKKSELDRSRDVRKELAETSFAKNPIRKLFLKMYLNYTVEQETFSKNFQRLRDKVEELFGEKIPDWFRDAYRNSNKPLMKYYAILTTNTRMIALSICVLLDQPIAYFFVEIVLINLVMVWVTRKQENISAELLEEIGRHGAA